MGVQVCLVIGGGNIFRGVSAAASGMDRASGDYMGMLATVINSLAMQSALERQALQTRVQSAIPMTTRLRALHPPPRRAPHGEGPGGDLRRRHRQSVLHDRYRRRPARRRDGRRCDAEGHPGRRRLFGRSASKDKNAKRYDTLNYMDVLSRDLQVMDASAISLARENRIPIIVFDIHKPGAFAATMRGKGTYTIIKDEG